ncbi:MAG TPA: phosphoribosylformylglycinamidine synthase subunit PurS [Firmicutes bacterium]|nr:phosphoribosylformylglycinamidine synthase subunit PurS [Bacillota bacterium]
MWKARVRVTLKNGILDPQGKVLEGSLDRLGYKEVREVRVGKYMEIALEAEDAPGARARVEEMCRRLLANPVIENFAVDIEPCDAMAAMAGTPGTSGAPCATGVAR